MLENTFKTNLVKELNFLFPGCIVLHLDPNEFQGIPDLLILYKNKWASLECKKSTHSCDSTHRSIIKILSCFLIISSV